MTPEQARSEFRAHLIATAAREEVRLIVGLVLDGVEPAAICDAADFIDEYNFAAIVEALQVFDREVGAVTLTERPIK